MAGPRPWDPIFALAWRTVAGDDRMIALPEPPALEIVRPTTGDFMARIVGRQRSTIRVSRTFAQAVHDEVTRHPLLLASVVLGPQPASTLVQRAVQRAVEDLAILFVIHHELSHLVSGHVRWRAASQSGRGRAFDEVRLGLEEEGATDAPVAPLEVRQAYYLEIEADGSGLQWLMQSHPPASIGRLLGRGLVPLADLSGTERAVAFRMLMAVVWLVIRLMEARRDSRLTSGSASHPRPAARLLAAIATMMEQFAQLVELRADARGQLIQTLGDQQAVDSRLFITEVVRPVLRENWRPGGTPAVPGDGWATLPSILRDLLNLLMVRKAATPAGIELEQLERLRRRMDRTLAPYRYARTRAI